MLQRITNSTAILLFPLQERDKVISWDRDSVGAEVAILRLSVAILRLFFLVPGIKPRASSEPSTYSITESNLQLHA